MALSGWCGGAAHERGHLTHLLTSVTRQAGLLFIFTKWGWTAREDTRGLLVKLLSCCWQLPSTPKCLQSKPQKLIVGDFDRNWTIQSWCAHYYSSCSWVRSGSNCNVSAGWWRLVDISLINVHIMGLALLVRTGRGQQLKKLNTPDLYWMSMQWCDIIELLVLHIGD